MCAVVPGVCSVAVEALGGLLEVAVAAVSCGEAGVGQVLPVEGAAGQFPAVCMSSGPLRRQEEGQGGAPRCQTPRNVTPDRHRP